MLVEVDMKKTRGDMGFILAAISGGVPMKMLIPGVYQIGHFNFDHEIGLKWPDWKDNYPDLTTVDGEYFGSYGVCDNYQQVLDACAELKPSDPTPYVLSVTPIRRKEQPSSGGWRWHKWGEYIGTQRPQCEYIYDEDVIDEVFCYHIYKVPPHLIKES